MRNLLTVVCLLAAPALAKAGFIVSGSAGSGMTLKPSFGERTPTSIMVAPGWGLGEVLRAELGIVADLPDVEARDFDMQLRPMLVLDPPILPFYGRLILGVFNLLDDPEIAYGGAVGIGGSLFGLGIFGELAVLPVGSADVVVGEARVGAFIAFD